MEVEIENDLEQLIKTVIVIAITGIGLSTILLLVAIVFTAVREHLQEINDAGNGNSAIENEHSFPHDSASQNSDDGGNINSEVGEVARFFTTENSRRLRSASQCSDGSGISSMRIATNDLIDSYNEGYKSRNQRTISRRGAFKWLPVYFSNDLVHGSYWFLVGSIFYTVISIVPVYMDLNFASFIDELKNRKMSDVELREESATFSLFSISGLLFSLGSIAFIRATEEHPMPPLFPTFYHINTDELLAAWLFLLGTIPFPCSIIVLLYYNMSSVLLWLFLIMSTSVVFSSYLFVISCYPGQIAANNQEMIPNFLKYFYKEDNWIFKHLSNDWLAGCWFFYISTFMITIGTFIIFLYFYLYNYNGFLDSFIWGSSTVDCIFFLIGGAYFVSGSYQQSDNLPFTLFNRQTSRFPPKNSSEKDEETTMLSGNKSHYGSI